MKRTLIISALLFAVTGLYAQETKQKTSPTLEGAAEAVVKWDTETMLDSLDQEKLPRLVSGGVFAGANMTNFIITRDHNTMASHRRVGGELGGFLDFSLSKHFSIQPQVIFTAHQNYFAATDTTNRLWSFGMEVPIYFLGRFGNMKQGYAQIGGGIFTHFTFASNTGKYRSVDDSSKPIDEPKKVSNTETTTEFEYDYSRLYTLHNNHFGICLMAGYECSFGMQINLQYKISLSDIAGFYSEMKGQAIANALIYPQSISLVVGYRWK
jgi:hypothetical protein